MVCKIAITLAAFASLTAASTLDASARGGGMGGGGMVHGGFGGGGAAIASPRGFGGGSAAFSRPGNFGASRGVAARGFATRSFGARGDRFAFRGGDRFHRRFFRDRFAFIDPAFGYSDDCYRRV